MSNLSGGEKTVAALALLFAIHRQVSHTFCTLYFSYSLYYHRAWDLGEEKDKEVQKFPLNRGDNKPRRCEQHF